jgi:hypothetical protein
MLLAGLLLAMPVAADMIATAEDGRKVVLRPNGTWIPAEEDQVPDGKTIAHLALEQVRDSSSGCRIGLRMQNDLSAQIRTLVLRFTAYTDGVPFETVTRGFSLIKPTQSQYQEIRFRGIACDEIESIEVFAARNCHVGELTKYSATSKHCLELVDVANSDLMPIAKRRSTR